MPTWGVKRRRAPIQNEPDNFVYTEDDSARREFNVRDVDMSMKRNSVGINFNDS